MLVATTLIVGAVGALFYADRLTAKLGITAEFIILFALSVAFSHHCDEIGVLRYDSSVYGFASCVHIWVCRECACASYRRLA
jgi:hypothetical protein